jgi:hypothetical protein
VVLAGNPDTPLSFEQAKVELSQIARAVDPELDKRGSARLPAIRQLIGSQRKPRPTRRGKLPVVGTKGGTKVRFSIRTVKGDPITIEGKVVDLDKLAALYPKRGKVPIADLIENGIVRADRAPATKARGPRDNPGR